MIKFNEEFDKELKSKYDSNLEMYKSYIEELKNKSIIAKQELLTTQFEAFPNNGSNNEKSRFILQFLHLTSDIILFPDDQVLKKLTELKFANHSLKWFVKLEDIINEIERLNKIEGLFFLPYAFLVAIHFHLDTKLKINLIEDFELNSFHNNTDTNIFFKEFSDRYKRRDYNEKRQQTGKMNLYEKIMNDLFDKFESSTDKDISRKIILQQAKGNTSIFYTILDTFHAVGISRDTVYLELFPLLKLILKDYEFLSYEEFYEKEDIIYKSDYNRYKIARVKKILQKK